MTGLTGFARAARRAAIYPSLSTWYFASHCFLRGHNDPRNRVAWLQRVAIAHRRWLNVHVQVHGEIPRHGLIVANHVSYLDIVALSSAACCAFVAKKEVGRWPIFGGYARRGATIFIDRQRRGAVAESTGPIRDLLDAQIPVTLFPEGTSSDGTAVLPFRSSLLEPAVQLQCPVVPCGIRYVLPGGNVPRDVAYWGNMTLAPHLWKLMHKRGVIAELHFGMPIVASMDRKQLTRELHAHVESLAGVQSAPAQYERVS